MAPEVPLRIVSLLPAATEMAFALGLGEQLLAVSHECDHPPAAAYKRRVVEPVLSVEGMTQAEIDTAVAQRLHAGLSLYRLDEASIRALAPDLILAQDLCRVCAAAGTDVSQLLAGLAKQPHVLSMTPQSLQDIFTDFVRLGEATGTAARAHELVAAARARLANVAARAAALGRRPRVFCMEWLDPTYGCGHWVPEMVDIAGGRDRLGRRGADSVRIAWEEILQWAPEVLIVMPCGYGLETAATLAQALTRYPGWHDIPAVRERRVYVVDANSYFARPALRVVEGTELLAHLLHPGLFDWSGPPGAFRHIGIAA